jgi:hypothetical protein
MANIIWAAGRPSGSDRLNACDDDRSHRDPCARGASSCACDHGGDRTNRSPRSRSGGRTGDINPGLSCRVFLLRTKRGRVSQEGHQELILTLYQVFYSDPARDAPILERK